MIRLAVEKDASRILSLLELILQLHKSLYPKRFENISSKYNLDDVIDLIFSRRIWVYEYDGMVVGYIIGWAEGDVYFVDDLMVDPEYRRCGIGGMLLDYISDMAIRLGCNEIQLDVWLENEAAVEFYIDGGFEVLKYRMFKKI